MARPIKRSPTEEETTTTPRGGLLLSSDFEASALLDAAPPSVVGVHRVSVVLPSAAAGKGTERERLEREIAVVEAERRCVGFGAWTPHPGCLLCVP